MFATDKLETYSKLNDVPMFMNLPNFLNNLNLKFIFQLVSSLCWSHLFWISVLFFPRWIQYASGPHLFGVTYCSFQSMFGQMFLVQTLLILDAIVVFKFLFIFVLKKPTLILDDFWIVFLNIYFFGFSFVAQGVLTFFQEGSKHINFHICSGVDPSPDLNTLVKFRGILFGIYFISVFLYTVIPIKIKLYKQNVVHEVQNNMNDKDLLLDMTVNFIRLCSLLMGIALSLIVSKISPFEFDKFSNTLMIFSLNILFPPFFIFIVCFSHYYRHQDLRTTVINYIINFF